MDSNVFGSFCPHRAGSAYINYKGFHSLILLAIVSYNYILVAYELGAPGRDSDSGVLERSQFGQALRARTLPLPDPQVLPGTNVLMPPVFVGDEAFALLPNLMRPYPGRDGGRLTELEDHFNYRLSRARKVSENFFAILQSRFRIYEGPIIAATPQTVATKVRATLVLHNWLQRKSNIRGHRYVDVNPPQVNNNFLELDSDIIENAEATAIRSTFARFFSSRQGRVQWRWQHY
ncbi:UNVERIFIED_CONTAM: hypothetical protein B566_EDAN018631 [Ephemera danica]|nr:hypothetical protein B566_EDAN018631 [Ephemera danica]